MEADITGKKLLLSRNKETVVQWNPVNMVTNMLAFQTVPVGHINGAFLLEHVSVFCLAKQSGQNEVTVKQGATVTKNIFKQSLWQMFHEV